MLVQLNQLIDYSLFQRILIYRIRQMIGNDSLSQKIQIYISCRNLKSLDILSKSDPYVKVSYKKDYAQQQFYVLGQTQSISNQPNPNFKQTFIIDYLFQSRQDIKFDIFDDDGSNNNNDYIGGVETTVGALMGATSQTSILDIKNQQNKNEILGKLVIRCQALKQSNEFYEIKFRAQKLLNVDSFFDFWDKSDPYLKFLKQRDDNTCIQVHRTQHIIDNLNPSWKIATIQTSRLINPNKKSFKLEVWDWQEDNNDQFIGQIIINPSQLAPGNSFQLTHPKKGKAGCLFIQHFKVIYRPNFSDYIRGGLQLGMIMAIDFTGSNGIPKHPTSLHFMSPNNPNQYQKAMLSISQILLCYDSDKRIPSFGFGGKLPGTHQVNHCFPLNTVKQSQGIADLMYSYKENLSKVDLSGPTYFGPLLQRAMNIALMSKNQGSDVYQILLILTDGQIHDMQKTIQLLVQASLLPISVVIVGVGNADFTNMRKLDGDNEKLSSKGYKAQRDIVQFVPFRDFQLNGDLLAKEVLAEIPNQIVQYMTLIGKNPGPYIPLDVSAIVNKK